MAIYFKTHLKTSLHARMLQSSRYRAVAGRKEEKVEYTGAVKRML